MTITLGPWRAEWEYGDDEARVIFLKTGRVLFMCEQRVFADIQIDWALLADAPHIIALMRAAPDLLAACEAALTWFTDQDEIEVEPSTERDALRAAIAKARGL